MPTIRFKHHPTGQTFLVDPRRGRVLGVHADAAVVSARDEVRESLGGVFAGDLLSVARDFVLLWKWPAPGTRFPPREPSGAEFPNGWFAGLEGRLNQSGLEGDLEFRGYLDDVEERRLAAGGDVRAERSALERHLCALDYALKGELGLRDLYRAFIANRLPPGQALKKAVGALLVFGRGRPVDIAQIAEVRPAARSGGFNAAGNVDPEIMRQYRRLFDTTSSDELDQAKLARFNTINFQGGFVSKQQWESFFATCRDLNDRPTVTYAQLVGLFDGSFEYVAASKADARGRRPLDRVMPG
ncbi:MAG: hypothetical protein ABW321_07620 [Polyangiales bacterium]